MALRIEDYALIGGGARSPTKSTPKSVIVGLTATLTASCRRTDPNKSTQA